MSVARYTILIIDDEQENIGIVQRKLANRQLHFLTACNGREGLSLALSSLPDLIILDWQMPVMNGLETVKALRSESATSAIPVIMMTGVMKDSEHLQTAFDSGASDFIRKPIDAIELRSRVNAAIALREEQEKRQQLELKILRDEIEQKQQALTEASVQLAHNNQIADRFIRTIRTALIELKQRRPEQEIEKEITKFRREMFSANWPSIETKFKETHTLFIAHLIKRFPGLTENELKLAVLFTMGLSTRDISAITFVSYEGIRKARTRLRNALRIEPDTDLEEFLKAIEKEL